MATARYRINNRLGKQVAILNSDNQQILINNTVNISLTDTGYQIALNLFGAANILSLDLAVAAEVLHLMLILLWV